MDGVVVCVGNFARAQTDRMFAAIQAQAGGMNRWAHYRPRAESLDGTWTFPGLAPGR